MYNFVSTILTGFSRECYKTRKFQSHGLSGTIKRPEWSVTPFSLVGGPRFTMTGDCDRRTSVNLLTLKRRNFALDLRYKRASSGRPQPFDECSNTDDVHHPLHVVGEHLQTHLGAYLGQGLGEEVRVTHPALYRAERMFDGLAT